MITSAKITDKGMDMYLPLTGVQFGALSGYAIHAKSLRVLQNI